MYHMPVRDHIIAVIRARSAYSCTSVFTHYYIVSYGYRYNYMAFINVSYAGTGSYNCWKLCTLTIQKSTRPPPTPYSPVRHGNAHIQAGNMCVFAHIICDTNTLRSPYNYICFHVI